MIQNCNLIQTTISFKECARPWSAVRTSSTPSMPEVADGMPQLYPKAAMEPVDASISDFFEEEVAEGMPQLHPKTAGEPNVNISDLLSDSSPPILSPSGEGSLPAFNFEDDTPKRLRDSHTAPGCTSLEPAAPISVTAAVSLQPPSRVHHRRGALPASQQLPCNVNRQQPNPFIVTYAKKHLITRNRWMNLIDHIAQDEEAAAAAVDDMPILRTHTEKGYLKCLLCNSKFKEEGYGHHTEGKTHRKQLKKRFGNKSMRFQLFIFLLNYLTMKKVEPILESASV